MGQQHEQNDFANIPFIASPRPAAPFSELLGRRAPVDNPTRMLEGWALEAEVGDWNTVAAGLLDILSRRRRTVARVVIPPGHRVDYKGATKPAGWNGTGFVVSKNLFLTNHHVLNSREIAAAASIEFEYETSPDDLLAARLDVEPGAQRFQVSPDRLFLTSGVSGGLDYTFVWIDDEASSKFGIVPMERASFVGVEYDPTFVIHHPKGRRKEASLDDTELLRIEGTVVHYAADTDYGSSGAPVFDRFGRLVALHHARTAASTYVLSDQRKVQVANEGIKISSIAIDLENRIKRGDGDAAHAEAVLRCIKGSDTLTGFFGGLGRRISSGNDVEAVVDTYGGTEQDVDIGFWNLEWLANRVTDDKKLEEAATVIVDLNLDIWGLVEVSPSAVEATVGILERKFGEHYAYALSEPDSGDHKKSTAVIWRTQTVAGQKESWPAEIKRLWHLDSRDALPDEAEHGKIFSCYPALFKFQTLGREVPFDFFVVPLHLKAMAEGGLQRGLASKLLVKAIQSLIDEYGCDLDWILGGDFNATLASDDFDRSKTGRFQVMSAQDKRAGAFTYLKSPRSLIDNIFVPQSTMRMSDARDFFIVAKDRSIDQYVQRISDHWPIVLRVSLNDADKTARDENLDDLADRLLRDGGRPAIVVPPSRHQASAPSLELEADSAYAVQGLSKNQFLIRNRARLVQETALVNTKLQQNYGTPFSPLTEQDVWVLIYIEAGVSNNVVDPNFRHSEGERGLLPLPSNVRYWNGADAPRWDRPMPLDVNLHHFLFYLGNLMNKRVRETPRFVLYRDLFRHAEFAQDPVLKAQLLAGTVHGYFVSLNYSDRRVPFDHILDGFGGGLSPDAVMRPTKYVHAGKSLMTNRANNIAAALALLRSAGG